MGVFYWRWFERLVMEPASAVDVRREKETTAIVTFGESPLSLRASVSTERDYTLCE
jgi:hypothetical protein